MGDDTPQTWHYGVVARWWSEFNQTGPEIAYFQRFIEDDGQPALDAACGTGRLLVPYLRDGLGVDGCDISGGRLVLDNEVPYADAEQWRYWREKREDLPEPWIDPETRRKGSDGTEYALRSRVVELDPVLQRLTMEMRAWMW